MSWIAVFIGIIGGMGGAFLLDYFTHGSFWGIVPLALIFGIAFGIVLWARKN